MFDGTCFDVCIWFEFPIQWRYGISCYPRVNVPVWCRVSRTHRRPPTAQDKQELNDARTNIQYHPSNFKAENDFPLARNSVECLPTWRSAKAEQNQKQSEILHNVKLVEKFSSMPHGNQRNGKSLTFRSGISSKLHVFLFLFTCFDTKPAMSFYLPRMIVIDESAPHLNR